MKIFLGGVVVVAILIGGWLLFGGASAPGTALDSLPQSGDTQTPGASDRAVVADGTYTLNTTQSTFEWAAKKPLIEGYVNSGTIGFKEGTIVVGGGSAQGTFTLDMNTLRVGLTAAKPGREGALETHLKSKDFFEVATYDTALFAIKNVAPVPDSATSMQYTITGDLTIKGKANEISFPATIYQREGILYAEAQTEIDRTKWGITFGSGNFFQNLGDNAISDMVAIAFSIVALPTSTPQ